MMVCCQPTNSTQPSQSINYVHRTQPVLSNSDGVSCSKETTGDRVVWSETVLFPWIQVVLSLTVVFVLSRLSVWKQLTRNKMKSCSNGTCQKPHNKFNAVVYKVWRQIVQRVRGMFEFNVEVCDKALHLLQSRKLYTAEWFDIWCALHW